MAIRVSDAGGIILRDDIGGILTIDRMRQLRRLSQKNRRRFLNLGLSVQTSGLARLLKPDSGPSAASSAAKGLVASSVACLVTLAGLALGRVVVDDVDAPSGV